MKGFYNIWRSSWSCDPDAANKLPLPLHKEAQVVSEKKLFEHCGRRRRTDAEAWVIYKLNSSGELHVKKRVLVEFQPSKYRYKNDVLERSDK